MVRWPLRNIRIQRNIVVSLLQETDGFEARLLIDEWIGFYNTERPHSALDGKTPAEAYRSNLRWPRKIGQLFKVYSTD